MSLIKSALRGLAFAAGCIVCVIGFVMICFTMQQVIDTEWRAITSLYFPAMTTITGAYIAALALIGQMPFVKRS